MQKQNKGIMKKNLVQIFSNYTPSESDRKWMESAPPESIKLLYDKEQKRVDISASFPRVIPRADLTRVEEDIRRIYEQNFVHFVPVYDKSLFSEAYIPERLFETCRMGVVAKGFFDRCHYRLVGDRIDIEIPFPESGVELVCDAKTPELMEATILNEFGIRIKVNIQQEQTCMPA